MVDKRRLSNSPNFGTFLTKHNIDKNQLADISRISPKAVYLLCTTGIASRSMVNHLMLVFEYYYNISVTEQDIYELLYCKENYNHYFIKKKHNQKYKG